MKPRNVIIGVCLLAVLVYLDAGSNYVVESPLIIKLRLEIQQDIQSVMEIQQQTRTRVEEIEKQVVELAKRIDNADSLEEWANLIKEGLGLLIEETEQRLIMAGTIEEKLERIAQNISRLEKLSQSPAGIVIGKKDIFKDILEARKMIADTFKGIHAIISDGKLLNPAPAKNADLLRVEGENLELVADKLLVSHNEASLAQQKEFIIDLVTFVHKAKSMAVNNLSIFYEYKYQTGG